MEKFTYAYFTNMEYDSIVDSSFFENIKINENPIFQKFALWNNHEGLDKWMYNLYREKGGTRDYGSSFSLILNEVDISNLSEAVALKNLPNVDTAAQYNLSNTFWQGVDIAFIENARNYLSKNNTIFYENF
jgi:hypothetical protein